MERLRRALHVKAEAPFSAEACAAGVSLSVSQMNRRFRQAYGTSPKAYWQKVRIARIQAMLRYGSDTLTSIANRFGFSDLFYFSKWFKHLEGVSPRHFRKATRNTAI
jgi:AraC-like DNA-binding protein